MKKSIVFLLSVMVLCVYLLSGCVTTNAQKGAMLGAGAGTIGSILGKGDRSTTAISAGVGSVVGYMLGNEVDKNNNRNQKYHTPPVQRAPVRRKTYQRNENNGTTTCRKITRRRWVDGKLEETVEEICNGRRTMDVY